jgi:hypothetical protein
MPNIYAEMLPKPPAEDKREAVEAFRQFAEALQQYTGQDMDVDVPVSVHPMDGQDNAVEVQMSVYVPKTDYANLVLVARCRGQEGYPVEIDPYFAAGTFPHGMGPCKDLNELNDALRKFAQSREILGLLDYMKRHARKNI